jgi:formylglycine-generating enzyme required for sulfatase activity
MYEHEHPVHEVTITQGFYLGRTEITQGQWESVMGTTPWSGQFGVQGNADNAAAYISWDDVQGLVNALNAQAGAGTYRLPSEAEWAYSCRVGTETRWSFGDSAGDLGDYAWYCDNAWGVGEEYAHQVGAKLANGWGLHDMHGNVYEWVQDWYGSYSGGAQIDPTGPTAGPGFVIRGGCFDGGGARYTRSANRFCVGPSYRGCIIGARLLRTH